jgi:enoyl-CoA hydratase/carnithine racemase
MEAHKIILEKKPEGNVAWIFFNNPEKYNVYTMDMIADLKKAIADVEADPNIDLVVITGKGEKAFCAGAHVSNFEKVDSFTLYKRMKGAMAIHRQIERGEKIYIAAVNGTCLGGGFEIALSCDFIVASERAVFSLPEINLGMITGWGGAVRLPRNIPPKKANEIILLGEKLTAAEAERYGLIYKVVPPNELTKAVEELLAKLKSKPKLALAVGKNAIRLGLETADIDAALEIERGGISILFSSEDCREGVSAFLEKRKANFKGK